MQVVDLSNSHLGSEEITIDRIISTSTHDSTSDSLISLYLYSNKLTFIQNEIFTSPLLINLQELWLDHNQLTSLPESIGCLLSLKDLSLHDNMLTAIPGTIGSLIHLEQLRLDRNQIQSLPTELGLCRSLTVLHLDGNNDLHTIPDSLDDLDRLQDLGIGSCPIDSLPPRITEKMENSSLLVWRV